MKLVEQSMGFVCKKNVDNLTKNKF